MKKQWKNTRGITLVSLVITILVLVILVGVSVSTVLNSGLISNTKDAVAKYKEAEENELKYIDKIDMAITGNKLPSGYQEVEYIKSNGSQYINPNINISKNSRLIFDMEPILNGWFFGYKTSTSGSGFATAITLSGNTVCDYYDDRQTFSSLDGRNIYDFNKNLVYVNNTLKATHPVSFDTSVNSLYIFKPAGNYGTITIAAIKLYNFKFYENDELKRDFIPCYRKSDNVIGMYDLVNNVFYTNQGTGTFEKGNDI